MVTDADLRELLVRWVRDGLIGPEQAMGIRAAERGRAERPRTGSLVTEGLGYVGGVLVLVAAVTIAGRYWSAFGVPGRLATVAGAAALLLAAGAVAPAGAAGRRMRAVAWALAVVAVGGVVGLLVDEVAGAEGEAVGTWAGAAATVVAVLLWWRHRTPLQQAVVVAAAALTAGVAASWSARGGDADVAGLAVWGVGVAWLLLGWGGVAGRDRAARVTADVAGGAAVVLGAVFGTGTDGGSLLAAATAVALVAAGVVVRDLVLLGTGALATLVLVPLVVGHWFPDTLAAPVALLVVGVLLVAGALVTARRPRGAVTGDRTGSPRVAVPAAVAVVVAVAVAVAVLGSGPSGIVAG